MSQRSPRNAPVVLLAALAAAVIVLSGCTSYSNVVLLDEYWAPDVVPNNSRVTEADTLSTHDPSQAKFGEVSALIENTTGWPNVRFRGAGWIELSKFPLGATSASLWYRTDAWAGKWQLEVWVHDDTLGPAPVQVMQCALDGGGDGGALVADDKWHQASGLLRAVDPYEQAPKNQPLAAFVWLRPTSGWDVAHKTYVDRVELTVSTGGQQLAPPPAPARRVRPKPGAQVTGQGWVWWEGEDAVTSNYVQGGPFLPQTAEGQKVLSNGAWLQSGDSGTEATWRVEVPQAGTYELWARGYWWQGSFSWHWDDAGWSACTPRMPLSKADWVQFGAPVYWVHVGRVELTAGAHTLAVKADPGYRAHCYDCWLLSLEPVSPTGKLRPDGSSS